MWTWKRFGILLVTVLLLMGVHPSSRVYAVGGSVEDALTTKTTQGTQEPAKPAAAKENGQGPSFVGSIVQLILVLLLLIVLFYGLVRFLSMRRGNLRVLGMRTIGVHPLTSNRSIHVVAMEDRILILGVGEDVTLLQTIDQPEKVERWKQSVPPQSFLWTGKGKDVLSFDALLRKKLEDLKKQRETLERWDEE
jgi:flagellar protein FliO/FliZ